jgi:hypothetical protein
MSSRAHVAAEPAEADEESPRQRRRLNEDNTAVDASLASVNDDCLILILSYLSTVDLNNSIPFCNQRLREARSHESLNQTRTATIVLSQGSSAENLFDRTVNNNWNEQLQGNFTHLKIVGLERLQHTRPAFLRDWRNTILGVVQLTGITSLDMACNPSDNVVQGRLDWTTVFPLALIFPNLTQVDLSYANIALPDNLCGFFCKYCPTLTRLSWNGCQRHSLNMSGGAFSNVARITELHLDDTRFLRYDERSMRRFSSAEDDDEDFFLFRTCLHLERLSMKNARFTLLYDEDEIRPESQDFLVKMVRRHPTLRWLRSDLTDENVAMLKQERPEITFVSE